jgi:hypothetical protein
VRAIIVTLAFAAVACSDPPPPRTSDHATPAVTATATAEIATPPDAAAAATAPDTASGTAPSPVAEEGPALVYQGLKLTPIKPAKAKTIEVKPDGRIVIDGEMVGSFANNEIRDEDGAPTMRVAGDGSVEALGPGASDKQARFDDHDDLVIPDGKVRLEKDGSVTFMKTGGKSEKAPIKVAGVTDENRRAAVLLVTYMMMMTRE